MKYFLLLLLISISCKNNTLKMDVSKADSIKSERHGKVRVTTVYETDTSYVSPFDEADDGMQIDFRNKKDSSTIPFFVSYVASNKSADDFGNCIVYLPSNFKFDNKALKQQILKCHPDLKKYHIVILGITKFDPEQANIFFTTDHSTYTNYR